MPDTTAPTRSTTPMPGPLAVLFDAYGTLFDVYSVGAVAETHFPGQGEKLAVLWRDKQIEYTRLTSMSGRERSFSDLTRGGLRYAAKRLKLELEPVVEDQLMACYDRLAPFPENLGVLQELKRRGIRAGILSNGDPDMLASAIGHAGFDGLVDPVLSVDGTGRFKTDPATYALGPQAFGLPAAHILFVSSNCWDAIGAAWYGYTTLWINRFDLPLEVLGTEPTHTAKTLADVLAFFPSNNPVNAP